MKILLVMDSGIKVPPVGYGGHERLVYLMALEYRAMGHEVHLLVTKGSEVPGCTVHGFGKEEFPPGYVHRLTSLLSVWLFLFRNHRKFDLVHNFGRLAFLLPILNKPVKKIMTYGRVISGRNIHLVNKLPNRNLVFTGASKDLISRITQKGEWHAVYNAIDFDNYIPVPEVNEKAPLVFLGRLERFKGCHTAIRVALETGNRLIIAGNISPLEEERVYFENEIRPFIDDKQIIYVGALNDQQKNGWLGNSKALLFPIEGIEAFGIVMIESMACGTPVIAFRHGAVDEVVEDGVTGFKVNDLDEMIAATKRIDEISRMRCRERAQSRFSASMIAREYIDLFEKKPKRALIVSTGQPAANPRVVKEYHALKAAGFQVKVLHPYGAKWSYQIDEERFRSGKLNRNDFILAGGAPGSSTARFFLSRIMFKMVKLFSGFLAGPFFRELSLSPHGIDLWLKAGKLKADIVSAHYLGALPAARRVARNCHAKLVFDAEDFHRGEQEYYKGQIRKVIAAESRLLPRCDHVTAASELISAAYREIFPGMEITTVNNVFSRSNLQKTPESVKDGLSLFWFSQYIGPKRGLEIVFEALNIVDDPRISLHILGNIKNEQFLQEIFQHFRFPENVHFLNPVEEDDIFRIASSFDVGLASEVPHCQNRDICLTNKIFTYLMSGNCILASNTKAQVKFMSDNPGIGFVYDYKDPADLAEKIKYLSNHKEELLHCRTRSIELAKSRMNWEQESGKLVALYERLVNS